MRPIGTILVVDDDPHDAMLIELALLAAGCRSRIHILSGGAEAIAYLKGTGEYGDRKRYPYPIIVITDLKMPGVDGLAVLECLRSMRRAQVIPSVVFSSSSEPDDVEKAYLLGASCYHVKPTAREAFAGTIKLLHDYWMTCEVPEVDASGVWKEVGARGHIGERYSATPFAAPEGG